jgi:hypothetical protein
MDGEDATLGLEPPRAQPPAPGDADADADAESLVLAAAAATWAGWQLPADALRSACVLQHA